MKRFWIQFGTTVTVLLTVIAVYIVVIDPFYHYHGPIAGTNAYFYTQIYQSPGIAKNFDYDSAIVGTSMTENFRASWFEEQGYRTQKICYSGGRTKDIVTVMDQVFQKNPDVKFIWSDIEAFQFTVDSESRYQDIPKYLYNNILLDDIGYWWNSDVFWSANLRVLEKKMGIEHNVDDAYTWEEPELFSREKILNAYRGEFDELRLGIYDSSTIDLLDKYAVAENNISNYVEIIRQYPNTEFVFYFPPYSAVYWHRIVLENGLWILDIDEYVAKELLKLENVRVYYFQDEFEWIENLENYRDDCHHTPAYNRAIFDAIWRGDKEMNIENVDSYFQGMREWIGAYDFESIWN